MHNLLPRQPKIAPGRLNIGSRRHKRPQGPPNGPQEIPPTGPREARLIVCLAKMLHGFAQCRIFGPPQARLAHRAPRRRVEQSTVQGSARAMADAMHCSARWFPQGRPSFTGRLDAWSSPRRADCVRAGGGGQAARARAPSFFDFNARRAKRAKRFTRLTLRQGNAQTVHNMYSSAREVREAVHYIYTSARAVRRTIYNGGAVLQQLQSSARNARNRLRHVYIGARSARNGLRHVHLGARRARNGLQRVNLGRRSAHNGLRYPQIGARSAQTVYIAHSSARTERETVRNNCASDREAR